MRGAGTHLAKVVGAVLGLLMMVLGKNLYKPLLFYLPAMLVGCAAIHPWVNKLETLGIEQGWTHGAGAILGLLLAALQRHILVWLLGMLLGFLVFTAVLLWTPYLNTSPAEVVLAVAIFCAFVGSTVVCQAERTSLWRITVCALVGSLLVTGAMIFRDFWSHDSAKNKPLSVYVYVSHYMCLLVDFRSNPHSCHDLGDLLRCCKYRTHSLGFGV